MREVISGSGYGSPNQIEPHFGLGDATNIDTVRIEWPSGIVQEMHDVAVKHFLTVIEPPRLRAELTNGGPQLSLKGGRNFQYRIETSESLTNWTSLSTLTITNLNGTVLFTDPDASQFKQRFYRALKL